MAVFLILFFCVSLIFPKLVFALEDSDDSLTYVPTSWQQYGSERHLWSILPEGNIYGYAQDRTHRSVFLVESWAGVGVGGGLGSETNIFPKFSDFETSFYLRPLQGLDRDFVWNYLDEDNYYQLHFSGAAEVTRRVDGNLLLTASKNLTLQQNEEYLVRIKSAEGKIEVWLNDEKIISTIDWTYSAYPFGSINLEGNYKFGFRLAPGMVVPVEVEFRDLQVRSIGGSRILPVPFYRQDDKSWGSLEYDHAGRWSRNPTMTRWGCAVTSAAMVFNYHGLIWLPDGSALTPETLNLWLVGQSDGYVGNGYLNWLALTRLSRKIHETFLDQNLPKFEFTRFNLSGDGGEKLRELLSQNIPVIGNVPGHFLVITGFGGGVKVGPEYERGLWVQIWNSNEIVWQVNDPFFEVSKIGVGNSSEIQNHPNGPLRSVRVLLPSQTDQSYWLFEHSTEVAIKISDASGQEIKVETETVEFWEDVDGFVEGENEKQTLTTSWVEKPSEGEYFAEVVGDGLASENNNQIKFWSYTAEAEIKLQELSPNQNYNFNYSKEFGVSDKVDISDKEAEEFEVEVIKPQAEFSWAEFIKRLDQAWEVGEIDEEYKYLKLKQWAGYAMENPSQRYLDLVESFLTYNTFHETRSWLLGQTF